MAGLRDLDSGKIYIGPEEPVKLDRSVETKNGDKPYDGTLAVTGPIFLGAHSDIAFGVVNMGTALGDFKPEMKGRALDIEGDVNIVGDGGGFQKENALVIDGDVFEDAGLCSASLIDLWQTVCEIKLHALDLCEDDADFDTYINYNEPTQGEGYVMVTRFGYFKLVDRSEFSYSNFNNTKFATIT